MAPSFMKKTMVYLGLLDDEYDEYDDLEDRAPRAFTAAARGEVRPVERESAEEFSGGMNRIRPMIPRESAVPSPTRVQPSPGPTSFGRAARPRRDGHRECVVRARMSSSPPVSGTPRRSRTG